MQTTKLVLNLIRKGRVAMVQANYRLTISSVAQFAELKNVLNARMNSMEAKLANSTNMKRKWKEG